MARTFECEDTKLLGYGSAVVHGQAASYIVIDAEAQVGLGKVTTRFIYLKSNCTRKDVDEAIRKYHNKSSHLLQPASGKIPHGVGPYPVNQLEDLVWQKLVDQYFEDYLRDGLNSIVADEHFIDPSSSDGPVMKVLQEYMTGNYGRDDGQLKVIKAGPGVGKTTVSRTLVHRLANTASSTKTIPIYVEAQHWMNNLQTDSRLYDVIKNSMALLSARFVPEEIFDIALRKGYLSFIFDGFDELCSYQDHNFDPTEVLDQLRRVCKESEARILLTTRSGFWELRVDHRDVRAISLKPFNTQQARGYFRSVFGQGSDQYKEAEALHKTLREHTVPLDHTGSVRDEVFNLPFCVRVLADYVKDGGRGESLEGGTFDDLLRAICERERVRQHLETPAKDQIASFVDVALADATERPCFALDDLLSLPSGGFRESDRNKIREHALVRQSSRGLSFSYEFLAPYLRAIGVRRALEDEHSELQGGLIEVLERERDGEGELSENLGRMLQPKNFKAAVRRCRQAVGDRHSALASFFFHLALKLSSKNEDIGSDTERTQALFFGERGDAVGRDVVGWWFCGTVENLDLTDVTFKSCNFEDVKFRRCSVNNGTVFDDCKFAGSLVLGPQWAEVDYRANCEAEFPADTTWEKVLRRAVGERSARAEMLLGIALGKFWHGGRFLGSIGEANWHRGWRGEASEASRVLTSMLKAKLITEVRDRYVYDRTSLADLRNFMDGRQKSGKVRLVFDDLIG